MSSPLSLWILQLLAALAAIAGFLLAGLILLVRSTAALVREGAGVLRYVVELFASAFTRGERPPESAGWTAMLPQWGLMALFLLMLVAVFLPQARLFQQGVAVGAAVAAGTLLVLVWLSPRMEVVCLPPLLVWGICYALLVWKR